MEEGVSDLCMAFCRVTLPDSSEERSLKEKYMNAISALLACSAFAAVLTAQQITPPKTNLKIGDEAPDFTLPDAETNKPVKLSDFRGKKVVVVAFFPAAFTGG
jgi:thioredoxin-dependent peroxiredoxin